MASRPMGSTMWTHGSRNAGLWLTAQHLSSARKAYVADDRNTALAVEIMDKRERQRLCVPHGPAQYGRDNGHRVNTQIPPYAAKSFFLTHFALAGTSDTSTRQSYTIFPGLPSSKNGARQLESAQLVRLARADVHNLFNLGRRRSRTRRLK